MAQVENLPKKLDTVTFVHIFKIRPIDIKHMMPVQFVTAYEHGLINWHIQIAENGGFPSFIRNILEDQLAHREPNYQITLHPAGSRERHPPVHKVHFKMRTVDSEDRDIFAPLTYTHPSGQAVRDILHSGYSTPEQHEIKHHIAAVLGKNIFEHLKFEITTTIDFEIEQFLSMQNLNRLVGKAMPVQLGFRYNLLTNQATHNFELVTLKSQSFPCNKEALFVASPFFRKNLPPDSSTFLLNVDYLEAVEVVITWLLTESYHAPSAMTPELAAEIWKLADRLLARAGNPKHLYGSLERHCFEELVKNHEDLAYVKRMLIMAHNSRLGSLLEACHAVIITSHYTDFVRNFESNPDEAFTQLSQFTRTSALSRLRENYMRSLCVKRFLRKEVAVDVADD